MASLDGDDDLIMLGLLYCLSKRKKHGKQYRRGQSVRINKYLLERTSKGRFEVDFEDLRSNPALFKENFHMTVSKFDELHTLTKPYLLPIRNTWSVLHISSKQKLAMTLEFLASGTVQRHIASIYRVSKQYTGKIIERTCNAIFKSLQPTYLKKITRSDWVQISNKYNLHWNFPNCTGSIDGKHIALKAPNQANSCFYNYKGFHSIVLMAVADSEYRFLDVDIGAYGSEGDSTVFRRSAFGEALMDKKLDLPSSAKIADRAVPFVFLADDAFPLHTNIMKPFVPAKGKQLQPEERIFNYRLSRARRCVENAFGILCARWIALARTLFANPDKAQGIVASCCALHNYLMQQDRSEYCPPGFADTIENGEVVEGGWREMVPTESMFNTSVQRQQQGRPTNAAVEIRLHLMRFFNSDAGQLEWQRRAVFLE